MSSVLGFGDFLFDSSEVLSASGSIEYPYIKIQRLRSFTTLQIGAKTTESIEVRALLSFARFDVLDSLAAVRSRLTFSLAGKNWGSFRIESIRQSIRFDGQIDATITFGQTTAVVASGDFSTLPNAIGSFGLVDFLKEELLNPIGATLDYPTAVLARLQNFPKIQDAEDGLINLTLSMKFDKLYNINPAPVTRLDTFRALGDTYSFYTLLIKGVNYGDYVLQRIAWDVQQVDGAGASAIAINCNLNLLQSPQFFPPRLPKIFSFLVNNIERVATLAPVLTSLTFQDPIDGGTSLLELEFDAEAAGLPVEGDIIRIKFGYDQEGSLPSTNLLDTGLHRCDRPIRRYTPDIVTIGSQSYDYSLSVNTIQQVIFSQSTLSGILTVIAANFGLTLSSNAAAVVVGTANDTTSNVVVSASTYLELLQQLALDYGYAFRIKYGTLSFQDYDTLDTQGQTFGLTPTDCVAAEFTTKVKGTYRTAFFPAQTGSSASVVDTSIPNNDSLDFRPTPYYDDINSAARRSKGELRKYNRKRHEGTITIEGRYNAIAGINILLVSFRDSSDNDTFQVNQATHKITATGGWVTELQIRKVFL